MAEDPQNVRIRHFVGVALEAAVNPHTIYELERLEFRVDLEGELRRALENAESDETRHALRHALQYLQNL